MRIEMETELAFTAMLMLFVLCASYFWWIANTRRNERVPAQRSLSQVTDVSDGEGSCDDKNDHFYTKAALYALQKHTDSITNVSATQISPQLYSNWLISAETFSMISTSKGMFTNTSLMLVVYDDLRSRVALCSSGFVKPFTEFTDILRGYPEYEGLANDLQGTYHHRCNIMGLPIPKVETPSCDANKDEVIAMPFLNTNSTTKIVTLEVKLNIPPDCGYQSFNEVIQKFTQHCNISQPSRVSSMVMGVNCVTVKFQVPASSLPMLERKITDSEQFLSRMKISVVKILDKRVFESDSGKNTLLKKSILTSGFSYPLVGFTIPELEGIGINVNSEHHGILQTKTSRCTVVLHEGIIYVGGGTTDKSKESLCKVLVYNPDTKSVLKINTKVKFFSLVTVNNKLTTVGGLGDNKTPSNKIYSWDKMTEEWHESCPPMPTARRSTTSVTYGNYLIVIGGALAETVTLIEVLDIPNKEWYTGPSLPENMYNVQVVIVDNSLYLFGGCSTSVWYCFLPTLVTGAISKLYNLSQLWKRLSSLPFRCSAAAFLGKHLLAIGGHDEEATNMTDLIHCYSPEKNCWEKAGRLRTGRRNCTAVKMLDETIFVIGGADSPAYNTYCQDVEVVRLCAST